VILNVFVICRRNFGKEKDPTVEFSIVPSANKNKVSNKFYMKALSFEAEVTASNKKEGKQLASQVILTVSFVTSI